MKKENRVLIITGGTLNTKEKSFWKAIRKEINHIRNTKSAWLEFKIKAVIAEPIVRALVSPKPKTKSLNKYFTSSDNDIPELTEVVLMGLLKEENVSYEALSIGEVFSDKQKTETLLEKCNTLFISSTLLHDLSELIPLVKMLKRADNRIVVGGALGGSLCHTWEGIKEVDILAIGYGELLMHSLVEWMNSDFQSITPPAAGRIVQKEYSTFLYSGVPEGNNLDFLPTPDWKLAEEYYGAKYNMVYYESVRGCPYRCAFCNYPYLFSDKKFRIKSAEKIVNDWEKYSKESNIEYITCLDSLFTMPKKRLIELCNLIIARGLKIKWICYARADDLIDEETVKLMKQAGAHQVQIGIESGSQMMLNNMNKRCTIESNIKAIENCRKYGITSLITLIVGYPGETDETIEASYQFVKSTKPDFYFIAAFSTRVLDVPVLNDENRAKFGLMTMENEFTFAPYWNHKSMSCAEVGSKIRALTYKIIKEKAALDGALFYKGILEYDPNDREELLDYQDDVFKGNKWLYISFNFLNRWLDRKLRNDVNKWLRSTRKCGKTIKVN